MKNAHLLTAKQRQEKLFNDRILKNKKFDYDFCFESEKICAYFNSLILDVILKTLMGVDLRLVTVKGGD